MITDGKFTLVPKTNWFGEYTFFIRTSKISLRLNEKIQPEGLKEYKVQPPIAMEPAQAPPVSNSVDPMDEANETNVIEDEFQQGGILEDNIQNRDFTDALVGKKVKALYENG